MLIYNEDMSMTYTTILSNARYTIRSYANGWAYEVDDHETSDTLWLQDHEADELKELTQNFTDLSWLDHYFENINGCF